MYCVYYLDESCQTKVIKTTRIQNVEFSNKHAIIGVFYGQNLLVPAELLNLEGIERLIYGVFNFDYARYDKTFFVSPSVRSLRKFALTYRDCTISDYEPKTYQDTMGFFVVNNQNISSYTINTQQLLANFDNVGAKTLISIVSQVVNKNVIKYGCKITYEIEHVNVLNSEGVLLTINYARASQQFGYNHVPLFPEIIDEDVQGAGTTKQYCLNIGFNEGVESIYNRSKEIEAANIDDRIYYLWFILKEKAINGKSTIKLKNLKISY